MIVDLPATSSRAERYNCDPRLPQGDMLDNEAGYIPDRDHQNPAIKV